MSGQSLPSIAERLAALVLRPVSPGTREAAAVHVLDWLGCAIAGAASEPGRRLRALAEREAPGAARVLGGGRRSARTAAFANGGLGNVLEMDDVHRTAILHPGPVVIPAALALAEERGATGAAFLDAVVRGYEAVIRVGAAVGPQHYAFFHNTATCGPFGAAAACASLLGLDAAQTAHALGLAGTQAGGFWQLRNERAMAKQLHTARAAEMGLTAALLAADGFTGPLRIFEGPQGFFAATCGGADPEAILAAPGGDWLMQETSFKPWPACRHAHPAIDAALALREQAMPSLIDRVEIATYRDAVVFCDRPDPKTVTDAKFSLQHAVAHVLLTGRPMLEDFEMEAVRQPEAAALRARVTVREASRFTNAYPAHFGASVALTLTDGCVLESEVRDALGDPEVPMTASALIAKAEMLMRAGGMIGDAITRLTDAALALPGAAEVQRLSQALPEHLE